MAAGLGFKTFATGDVLTASDTNGYLMQGVWVFADAAARTAAVTSPQEGNMSYLKSTDSLEYYSGSAWVAVDTTGVIPPIVSGKNALLNGALDIWQRGTSITMSSTAYGADRWSAYSTFSGGTVSRQTTSDTTNLPFIQYCARVQRDNGSTNVNTRYFYQSMETANCIPFVGKKVTLSFYARSGANYSSTSGNLEVKLGTGTGTDQNWVSYTGLAYAINQNVTLTTTWQRFTITTASAIATTVNELTVAFGTTPTGTAGANDYFEITGIQLESGSSATDFSRYSPTLQGELAACQRYYQSSGANVLWSGNVTNTVAYYNTAQLPVVMRTAPTVTLTIGSVSSFPATNPTASTITAATIWAYATANATANGGYFSFTYTASSELQERK